MAETLDTLAAKIDTLATSFNTRFDAIDTRLDGMDSRFDRIDTRLDGMDSRFDGIDTRFGSVDKQFSDLKTELLIRIEAVDSKVDLVLEKVDDLIKRDVANSVGHARFGQRLDNHELRIIALESRRQYDETETDS